MNTITAITIRGIEGLGFNAKQIFEQFYVNSRLTDNQVYRFLEKKGYDCFYKDKWKTLNYTVIYKYYELSDYPEKQWRNK